MALTFTEATRSSRRMALASGWAVGAEFLADKAAVLHTRLGEGRIVLFGSDVVFRGQPQGSLKMLFNAVLLGPASRQRIR